MIYIKNNRFDLKLFVDDGKFGAKTLNFETDLLCKRSNSESGIDRNANTLRIDKSFNILRWIMLYCRT